ncbi:MAG: hypothetical protein KAI06_07945, partial [Anaerolineales bacterium]|nr:hypothetical protein [Anaerolineales bacterium]
CAGLRRHFCPNRHAAPSLKIPLAREIPLKDRQRPLAGSLFTTLRPLSEKLSLLRTALHCRSNQHRDTDPTQHRRNFFQVLHL